MLWLLLEDFVGLLTLRGGVFLTPLPASGILFFCQLSLSRFDIRVMPCLTVFCFAAFACLLEICSFLKGSRVGVNGGKGRWQGTGRSDWDVLYERKIIFSV